MILTKENTQSVNIDDLIHQKISSGRANQLLIIVPTNRKLRRLKKEIICSTPGKAAAVINVETIGTIAAKLLEQSYRFIQLSEAAATVLIKQSASEIDLKYFSTYKGEIPHGTLDRVKNVISDYKKHGITFSTLRNEAEKLERNEKLKAVDIAGIFEVYLAKCKKLNALEIGDIYREVGNLSRDRLKKSFKKLFPDVDLVLANGFNEFTSPEVEILDFLSYQRDIKLYLNFDYFLYNPLIFSHLDKCYEKLEKKGFNKIEDKSVPGRDDFKNSVRANLFLTRKGEKEKRFNDKIVKITAVNREEEIELIAKEIKRLILEENIEPNRICVAFNLIHEYSPLIRDKFATYGIPYNLTDRISLDNSLPVTAIINFLEILESDFYYKNIFRAISSGFVNLGNIDSTNLMRVASALKIVVGADNWQNIIKDAIQNLKFSDDNRAEYEAKKKRYSKALADVQSINKLLKSFTGKFTIPEFLSNLERFAYDIKIFNKLLENAEGKEEEHIKAVSTFFETVTEIFNLLKQQYGSDKKFGLKFYLDQLRTACGWARFNVKEKSEYGVLITTVEEIRGFQFSHLFISGLCDGDFPTRFSPEIFFSGSYVKQEIIHQTEERYKFYQSLCSWDLKLYLSHPISHSGKELVESIFLKDFTDYFEVTRMSSIDFENTIYSKEEFIEYCGLSVNEMFSTSNVQLLSQIGFDTADISRPIQVDKVRISNPSAVTSYTGFINPVESELSMKGGQNYPGIEDRIKERMPEQFSISQLESYAQCPFKYFIERILKLESFEEPVEEIESVELGSLLHAILYKFYSALREKGIVLNSIRVDQHSDVESLLFDIARREIEGASFLAPLSFYEKEKILGLASNKNESILHKLFEEEVKTSDGYTPSFFEVGFGKIHKQDLDNVLSSENPVELNGIKLRGKIDRVEINKEEKKINVIDYKLSGKRPTIDELWKGLSLQLPLYLYAAQKLFENKYGTKYNYNKMFIYSLKYAASQFGKKEITISQKKKDAPQLEDLIHKSLEATVNYVESISKGIFHLTKLENNEEKICRYCDFKSICRIKEIT